MSAVDAGGVFFGAGSTDFRVGGVVRRAVGLLRQNGGALVVLSLLLGGVLPFLMGFAYARIVVATMGAQGFIGLSPFQSLILLPFTTVSSTILNGAVVHLAAAGRPGWFIGPSLRTGLRFLLPNLAIYVLTTLGIGLGFMLLAVPGLMLVCRWLVVIPAEVVERTGVLGALRRSRDLTRGCRWRVLGVLLVSSLVLFIPGTSQVLLARTLLGGSVPYVVTGTVGVVVGAFTSLVGALGAVAVYLELRRAKEGGLADEIVSVFD